VLLQRDARVAALKRPHPGGLRFADDLRPLIALVTVWHDRQRELAGNGECREPTEACPPAQRQNLAEDRQRVDKGSKGSAVGIRRALRSKSVSVQSVALFS